MTDPEEIKAYLNQLGIPEEVFTKGVLQLFNRWSRPVFEILQNPPTGIHPWSAEIRSTGKAKNRTRRKSRQK